MIDRDNSQRKSAIADSMSERVFPEGPDRQLLADWIGSSRNAQILEINLANEQLTIPMVVGMKRGRVYTLATNPTAADNILVQKSERNANRLIATVADVRKLNLYGARLNDFVNGQQLNTIVVWNGFDTIPTDDQSWFIRGLADRLKPNGSLVFQSPIGSGNFPEVAERLQGYVTAPKLDVGAMARIRRATGETVAIKGIKPNFHR